MLSDINLLIHHQQERSHLNATSVQHLLSAMAIYNVTCWFTVMINLTNARSVLSPLPSTATYRPTCTSILGKGPIVAGTFSNSLTWGKGELSLISLTWYVLGKIVESLSKDGATATQTAKKQWVYWAKQQLCTCTTLFCSFFCRCCTSSTWNYVVSRLMETDVNTRQQFSFFSELRYSDDLEIIPTFDKSCEWIRIRLNKFETVRIHF